MLDALADLATYAITHLNGYLCSPATSHFISSFSMPEKSYPPKRPLILPFHSNTTTTLTDACLSPAKPLRTIVRTLTLLSRKHQAAASNIA
ncbi:hypothetical protein DMENIID0001_120120 [Sergentomyia squamirostris]